MPVQLDLFDSRKSTFYILYEFNLVYFICQAEKAEKEKMKQVVLGIHERQEEEDYQGNTSCWGKCLNALVSFRT